MAKPTILIGVGTSGLRVLEEVQRFYYENTGRNRPEHVEYLYMETDENSYPGVTAEQNEIRRIYLDLRDKETMINSLKHNKRLDTTWLPNTASVADNDAGAGGWPVYGRAALWGHDNFTQVYDSIRNAHSRVGSIELEEAEDSKPAVFITGSLTGGTGSGVFIDLAYMVRDIIDQISELFGLFLIPGKKSGFKGMENIYCNTYAALKALDFYNELKEDSKYKQVFPNEATVNFATSPYQFVQIVSQDYDGNAPSIESLTGLYKMAGLYMFLNIYGLREKRMKRLVDAWQNNHIGKYGTFGLSAIQYPKSQIEEYLGIRLSTDLLKRWIDPNMYYAQGNKVQINAARATIYNDTMMRFERLLRDAFNTLDSVEVEEGRKVYSDLERQAKIVNRKEYQGESDYRYILDLFTSNKAGNYYHALKNNVRLAEDVMIQGIQMLISSSVDQYENLYLAKMQLESMKEAVDQCLRYWQSIGLSGQPAKWEGILEKQIRWMLKGRYKFLLEQDNVLRDRMRTTLELMKMHLLANKIVEIRNNIVKGDYAMKTFADDIELPTIATLNNIITIITKTVGDEELEEGDRNYNVLKDRKMAIENDIQDTSIPILRVFPSRNFEVEINKSLQRYNKNSGTDVPTKRTIIGEDNLWRYLTSAIDTLNKRLYQDCISKYEQDIRRKQGVEDMDIGEYIQRQPKEAEKIARRATMPLLKVNPDKATTFSDSKFIPKMVIGPDNATISRVIKSLKELNFNVFENDEDNIFVKEELRNIVVFYVEKGKMNNGLFNPLRHLRYTQEIQDLYEQMPEKINTTEEQWHLIRNPYVKLGEKK